MRRRGVDICALLACALAALAGPASAHATLRDDTASLQSRLDAGGPVFLPKLANGDCYRTRGLWLSHDDTTITSDGACIVATGLGEARIKNGAGRPVHARAVFFIEHSSLFKPQPVRVSISGVRIVVPAARVLHGVDMDGIDVDGHEITLDHLTVTGSPGTDVLVGGGKPGSGGMSERISIHDSTLSGGVRNVVSVFGPIGLHVEHNTIARGHAVGLRIGVGDRGQPALDVHVVGNSISGNAGSGVVLALDPKNGAPVFASGIEISGNRVQRNGTGLLLAGGQRDGKGTVTVSGNVVRANRGAGIVERRLRFRIDSSANDLRSNKGGAIRASKASSAEARVPSFTAAPPNPADATAYLQARLDAGSGKIFLPSLPNGACYATRGLWVSHDDTTITSDGACIVALGPGEVRLHSIDGDPISANGVFFVNRSSAKKPTPVNVTISNLHIVVPDGSSMYGIAIFGHQVTVDHVTVSGAPIDDVLIGGRANGNGYVGTITVRDSTLSGAGRNGISAFGVFGLRIERNTIAGVRDDPHGMPAAGIDVEPDDRAQPTLDVHIVGNVIEDNAGPGILLSLEPNTGPGVITSDLEVSGNTVVHNGTKRTPPVRAGIVVTGGEDDGAGTLLLVDNVVHDNAGPGILLSRVRLVITARDNDVHDNDLD